MKEDRNKQLALKIKANLFHPDQMDTLIALFQDRIERRLVDLEQATDPHTIYRAQGAIKELREFLKLKDHTVNILRMGEENG